MVAMRTRRIGAGRASAGIVPRAVIAKATHGLDVTAVAERATIIEARRPDHRSCVVETGTGLVLATLIIIASATADMV